MTALIKNNERAFTLIELLIVIGILGVLAAIAIPQFSSYRTRSYNSSAQADLRNAITVQEDYYIEQDAYCLTIADLIGAKSHRLGLLFLFLRYSLLPYI